MRPPAWPFNNKRRATAEARESRSAVVEEQVVEAAVASMGQAPRSGSSDAYVRSVLVGGAAKNLIDVVRSAVKIPEAARAGQLVPALAQTLTASPTARLIDPAAPRVATAASGWKSFTALDEALYRSASLVGVGLGAFQLGSAVPNIVGAVRSGGARALVDTRAGREGLLQAAGGAVTLGAFARGGLAARAAGVRGAGPFLLAAAGSSRMASPLVLGATFATGGLVFANSRGFLDFLNQGERRSFAQVESDAWRGLGVGAAVRRVRERLDEVI